MLQAWCERLRRLSQQEDEKEEKELDKRLCAC